MEPTDDLTTQVIDLLEETKLYKEKIDELNRLVKLLSDENFTLRWQLSEQD